MYIDKYKERCKLEYRITAKKARECQNVVCWNAFRYKPKHLTWGCFIAVRRMSLIPLLGIRQNSKMTVPI